MGKRMAVRARHADDHRRARLQMTRGRPCSPVHRANINASSSPYTVACYNSPHEIFVGSCVSGVTMIRHLAALIVLVTVMARPAAAELQYIPGNSEGAWTFQVCRSLASEYPRANVDAYFAKDKTSTGSDLNDFRKAASDFGISVRPIRADVTLPNTTAGPLLFCKKTGGHVVVAATDAQSQSVYVATNVGTGDWAVWKELVPQIEKDGLLFQRKFETNGPRLWMSVFALNLGKFEAGARESREITLLNIGNQPLKPELTFSSPCTSLDGPIAPIPPGSVARVPLRFDTGALRKGSFTVTMNVSSNDAKHPDTRRWLQGWIASAQDSKS